jgi:low molecular weight protein-tyrosine phosphatase
MPVSVLFVCLGNICRSPTAHGVLEAMVIQRGLEDRIQVDSCGTGDWHVGHSPDTRATAEAAARGYDLSHLRARQVKASDFEQFDYILAMDRQNLADLEAMRPAHFSGYLGLFLPFAAGGEQLEVPDPYYGGDCGFTEVLEMVEAASEGLLQEICGADSTS